MSNRIHHAFDQIHADESLKERTKAVIHAQKRRRSFSLLRPIPVICSFLIVSMIGLVSYFTPVSAISIDINPSIELSLNPYNRVIRTKGYGPQAEEVLASLDLINCTYTDAITQMMASDTMSTYLAQDDTVSITVLSSSQQKYDEITASVSNCMQNNVSCYRADPELVQQADASGLSFGKYRAYLQLQETHPEITVDEVRQMSMCQIQQLIDGDTDTEVSSSNNHDTPQHYGYGQMNRHQNGKQNGNSHQ